MTNKQKTLIESAKPYKDKIAFRSIYIINSGKNYNDFLGKNSYRQIIVIGETSQGERYKIDYNEYDALNINNTTKISLMFDIYKDKDCLSMWVYSPYKIIVRNKKYSTLVLEVTK